MKLAVAHLLHDTFKAIGLAPGPRDEILGWESEAALKTVAWNVS